MISWSPFWKAHTKENPANNLKHSFLTGASGGAACVDALEEKKEEEKNPGNFKCFLLSVLSVLMISWSPLNYTIKKLSHRPGFLISLGAKSKRSTFA